MSEDALSTLLEHVADHGGGPDPSIIDASIAVGQRRLRHRRIARSTASLAAACVITAGVTWSLATTPQTMTEVGPGAGSSDGQSQGVPSAQVAETLASLLPDPARASRLEVSDDLDGLKRVTPLREDLEFMVRSLSSASVQSGTLTYRTGEPVAQVGVAVIKSPAVVVPECTLERRCTRTTGGDVVRTTTDRHGKSAMATYVSPGRGIVQVAVSDVAVLSTGEVMAIAMNEVWLR